MKDFDDAPSFDDFDEIHHPRPEECEFDAIVENAISRRGFMSVVAMGTATFLTGTAGFGSRAHAASRFGFEQVAATSADTITVPPGFSAAPVVTWGDPLWSDSPAFDWSVRGTAEQQKMAFGDNNDGMTVFSIDGLSLIHI